MTTSVSYPFDPSGSLASNLVSNEEHSLVLSDSGYMFVVPFAAPFVKTTLKVVLYPGGKVLKEGVDFVCTHFFKTASVSIAKGIYGSITFFNKLLTGKVRLTYQTIGGDWAINQAKALTVMSNTLLNPRIAYWEQIADLPYAFPPINHSWSVDTLYGMKEVVAEMANITAAIRAKGGTPGAGTSVEVANHLANLNNPHQTTKAQVGLGVVANYRIALESEARAGVQNDVYMTPLMTKSAIDALALAPLALHVGKTDNPHGTTKAQVGLSNVQNYLIASDTDVTDGTSDTAYMTPLRTKNMILAVGGGGGDISKDADTNYFGSNGEFSQASGFGNFAVGLNALQKANGGTFNIALGQEALYDPAGTSFSVAIGFNAMRSSSTAFGSIALGWNALCVGGGNNNIAIGQDAMASNVSGHDNLAIGQDSLHYSGTSHSNVALGRGAMMANSGGLSGWGNIAIGYNSGKVIAVAENNILMGYNSGGGLTTGDYNIAIGYEALKGQLEGNGSIAIGYQAQLNANGGSIGFNSANVAIGYKALMGTAGNNSSFDNVAIGSETLTAISTGEGNVAVGARALKFNTEGYNNCALGQDTLRSNTTGGNNTAVGWQTLFTNTDGTNNVAIGAQALFSNTTGSDNVAIGNKSLTKLVSGGSNIAVGFNAMTTAVVGTGNVALGRQSLMMLESGSTNIAIGSNSLKLASVADANIAVGANALSKVTTGSSNIALGQNALNMLVDKGNNTAIGHYAGLGTIGEGNVAVGYNALSANTTGTNNTAIGTSTDVAAVNLTYATAIGAGARVNSSNTLVLGRPIDVVVIGASGDSGSGAKLQVSGFIKASTPATSDNSTTVATTAFVKAALAGGGQYVPTSYLGYGIPTVPDPRDGVGYETGNVLDVTDTLNHLFTYASSGKAAIVAAGQRIGLSLRNSMSFYEIAAVLDTITSFSIQITNSGMVSRDVVTPLDVGTTVGTDTATLADRGVTPTSGGSVDEYTDAAITGTSVSDNVNLI